MSFNGNFMCTSFKVQLLQGKHDFTNGQDQFKLALLQTPQNLRKEVLEVVEQK